MSLFVGDGGLYRAALVASSVPAEGQFMTPNCHAGLVVQASDETHPASRRCETREVAH